MTEGSIARLNELAHLKKQRPLTPEETAEQAALRLEYLAAIRENLRNQLDHTTVLYAIRRVEAALKAKDESITNNIRDITANINSSL